MPRAARAMDADPRSYATHRPKAVGGALCLDFINTVTWRGDPAREAERLIDYAELVHWAAGFHLIEGRVAKTLLAAAREKPRQATNVLRQALKLRAELEAAFDEGRANHLAETTALLRDLRRIGHLAAGKNSNSHHWQPAEAAIDLRLPLLPIAVSAMDLAISTRRQHLKSCADPDCGWLFLDETRNHSRQWCSMEDCGNRAKARAHYARIRAVG